jgi:hypothetical protein
VRSVHPADSDSGAGWRITWSVPCWVRLTDAGNAWFRGPRLVRLGLLEQACIRFWENQGALGIRDCMSILRVTSDWCHSSGV